MNPWVEDRVPLKETESIILGCPEWDCDWEKMSNVGESDNLAGLLVF